MTGSIILCNNDDLYQLVDSQQTDRIKSITYQVVRMYRLLQLSYIK
jgi:hypothetical protein